MINVFKFIFFLHNNYHKIEGVKDRAKLADNFLYEK